MAVFKDTPEMLDIRARKESREAHIAFAKAHPELLIGGGLKPAADELFWGVLWVDDKADVENLVTDAPFYFPLYRALEVNY